ncbi:MAG: nucleotidyltransferase domain-containing protein [Candidatus Woesearchaeota archaeon]
MRSKEDKVLELFFNYPKQWHFEELLEQAQIGRPQLAKWLIAFQKEGIIKRVKPKGRMPYYVHNFSSLTFRSKKRQFALQTLQKSGLFDHLARLKNAKVVILFGSFAREDWYADSDVDIFIYGKGDEFERGMYESRLGREIQVHNARNNEELQKMKKLLPYIIAGNYIKGSLANLGVEICA